MVNLGRMYVEGIGVRRDDVHGYALIKAALDLGVPASMKSEAVADLDAAAARMRHSKR
jgi:TPR repeat protein